MEIIFLYCSSRRYFQTAGIVAAKVLPPNSAESGGNAYIRKLSGTVTQSRNSGLPLWMFR